MLAQTELPLPDEGSGEEETGLSFRLCLIVSLFQSATSRSHLLGFAISAVGKKLLPPSSQTRNSH